MGNNIVPESLPIVLHLVASSWMLSYLLLPFNPGNIQPI